MNKAAWEGTGWRTKIFQCYPLSQYCSALGLWLLLPLIKLAFTHWFWLQQTPAQGCTWCWFSSTFQHPRVPHIGWMQLDVGDGEHGEGYEFFIMFLFHLGLVIYYFPLQVWNHYFHAHFEFPCYNKEKKMELYPKYWLRLSKEHWNLLDCGKISQGKWQKSRYLAHFTTSPNKTLVNVLCFGTE